MSFVAYNYTAAPVLEPDTTLGPLDLWAEARKPWGDGTALSGGTNADGTQFTLNQGDTLEVGYASHLQLVAGKFTNNGIKCLNANFGQVFIPSRSPISQRTFCIRFWASHANWSSANGLLFANGLNLAGRPNLSFGISAGNITVKFEHTQNGGANATISAAKPASVTNGAYSHFMVMHDGVYLSVWINGVLFSVKALCNPISEWDGRAFDSGLNIFGNQAGQCCVGLSISDFIAGSLPRTQGVTPAWPDIAPNTITVNTASAGRTINPDFCGIVEPNNRYANGNGFDAAGQSRLEATLFKLGNLWRTGKFNGATPMIAGSTPDATRTVVGASGAACYDRRIVDRSAAQWAAARAVNPNMKLYLDATDLGQIESFTGGVQNPPYSGTDLTGPAGKYAGERGPSTGVPSNNALHANILSDLVDLIQSTGQTVKYHCGGPNEPNLGVDYVGTIAQAFACYAALLTKFTAKFGSIVNVTGGETSYFDGRDAASGGWIAGLIKDCADNNVKLPFVSFHHYDGNIAALLSAQGQINLWFVQYGLNAVQAAPPVAILTEGDVLTDHFEVYPSLAGTFPFATIQTNLNVGAHGASTLANFMINGQNAGAAGYIFYNAYLDTRIAVSDYDSFNTKGLCTDLGVILATGNVYLLWQKMQNATQVTTSGTLTPDLNMTAFRDAATGRMGALVSRQQWLVGDTKTLTLSFPSLAPGTVVVVNRINQAKANAWEAGNSNANLTPEYGVLDSSSNFTLTLTAREVAMVECQPFVPGNVVASVFNGGTVVTWNAPTSSNTGVTYTVKRNGVQLAAGLTLRRYIDTTTVNGVVYTYTVEATDGSSVPSGPSSGSVFVNPGATITGQNTPRKIVWSVTKPLTTSASDESTETLRIGVGATTKRGAPSRPAAVDIHSQPVYIALVAAGVDPVEGDFKPAVWLDSGTVECDLPNVAEIEIGPGANVYARGAYVAWVRVIDNPDRYVAACGRFAIT